ncbi:RNA-binding protein 25-like [Portunus trituberculatus]|uniref:RNA-binding protein 25-like n=1 Tax=Portunus trituberculatus TaxID=210409 RepID=UPI001E1CF8CE|nr:RNA-binding protein 25-like [Portunus trituberculatus]
MKPTQPLKDTALPSPPSHDTAQPSRLLPTATQPPPEPFRDEAQPPAQPQAATQVTEPPAHTVLSSPTLEDTTHPPPTPFKDTKHSPPTAQPPQPFRDASPPPQVAAPPQDTQVETLKPAAEETRVPEPRQPPKETLINGWGEGEAEGEADRENEKEKLEKEKEREREKEQKGEREAEKAEHGEQQQQQQKHSCRDSASSLEGLDRPTSEELSLDGLMSQDEAEKAPKASKVSRFVRMFNRREVSQTEASLERASGRKTPIRVWAMCLQAQSPNKDDDDDDLESSSEVIKSEPHLDQCPSGSHKGAAPPWGDTSSLGDVHTRHSLDSMAGDVEDKRRSLNIEVENRSLIRSSGGRRSFDKPQSRARLTTKRSNTLEDMDDSRHAVSRSSKTLPAKPTSAAAAGREAAPNTSPFYRRFYSHCMILPAKRRKRAKNKNRDNMEDSSSQGKEEPGLAGGGTVAQRDNDAGTGGEKEESEEAGKAGEGEGQAVSPLADFEDDFDDSPKRLPVMDGFLAEIMESVTLIEKEMTEDEAENDDEGSGGEAAAQDNTDEDEEEQERRSSLELLSDGKSRVTSLISRFEQCGS